MMKIKCSIGKGVKSEVIKVVIHQNNSISLHFMPFMPARDTLVLLDSRRPHEGNENIYNDIY